MSNSAAPDSLALVFGSQMPGIEVVNPLGKEIRIRIDLDGCTGLPPNNKGRRRSWLKFQYISSRYNHTWTNSSTVYEGKGIHRGTVQWNETIYIDCFEFSPIFIRLSHGDYFGDSGICASVEDLIKSAEIILWPEFSGDFAIRTALHLSASRVLDNRDKRTSRSDPAEAIQRNDRHIDPPDLWNTVFCQFSPFTMVLNRMVSEVFTDKGMSVYWIHRHTFQSFRRCQRSKSLDPRIGKLLTDMGATVHVVRQSPYAQAQHGRNVVKDIIDQIYWLSCLMYNVATDDARYRVKYNETELARLIIIIGTPDPTLGASSTSASTNWNIISGTITKDALLLALEAIVQSADAFPPLKSAASGLLFFATCADTASSNKKQIRDVYRRVESLAASLNRGAQGGDLLSPEHQEAIAALAQDIAVINEDLQDIIDERKSIFKRFFGAKRHREELKDVVNQLEVAKSNYMLAMATLNGVALAEVRGHMKAMALVMDFNPVYALGTRRADAITFPDVPAHIEEV